MKTTKMLTLASVVMVTAGMTACSQTPVISADAPVVYLNTNIGFSQENYAYAQPEMICDIDKVLVDLVVDRAARRDIRVEKISNAQDIYDLPVDSKILAIDISKLGTPNERMVGSGAVMQAPELGLEAVYFAKSKSQNIKPNLYSESCTGVLNTGASMSRNAVGEGGKNIGGGTDGSRFQGNSLRNQCRMIKSCGKSLSNKLAKWLNKEVR